MPSFMLDTDTVSFALRGHGRVGERILEHRPSELCISSITLAELRFGADLKRSKRLHGLITTFVRSVGVLPFDVAAAEGFGALAATLRGRGASIGGFDTLIAAHALAAALTLVTGNTKHFGRVPGLTIVTWV
jgi:tRNA(fMet)-specific endonuclease VapC